MKILQLIRRLVSDQTGKSIEALHEEARRELAEIKSAVYDLVALLRVVEERSRSLEYSLSQSIAAIQYQIDFSHKHYLEATAGQVDSRRSFNACAVIKLQTEYPLAWASQDHISPDSTVEGVTRPTKFVRDCIEVLGAEITALDLGTGGAGLVFEWAMNDILAIGVDGSDFNAKHKLGFWPILKNNLTTCDITKRFEFIHILSGQHHRFDVITMWEVLEHIGEVDLDVLFTNIHRHLNPNGYFIGSISLLEYTDKSGNPYHVTLKSKDWWEQKFSQSGLQIMGAHPFNEGFFCRGNGPRYQDFHNYAATPTDGFLFVAQIGGRNEDIQSTQVHEQAT